MDETKRKSLRAMNIDVYVCSSVALQYSVFDVCGVSIVFVPVMNEKLMADTANKFKLVY